MRMRGRSRRSNWNPPRKSEGRNCGARPMRGRSRRSPRSVALAYSPSRRKGKTRRGSRQRPPRRGKGKSLLRPMLRRRPTTSNADELDAVPASAEGTPLHRTPFLSVGSKCEDLQPMLEIFLSSPSVASARTSSGCWRSFSGDRKFDLWSNRFVSLARSSWSSRAVCSCLVARAYHQQQTATDARSSAGPRIHYIDAPQTQPSSARLRRQQAGRGRLKPGARQTV